MPVAEDKVRVDNPTQNLESYFLAVVEQAKRSAAETSGATSGHRVAAYLRGEGETRPATDKILERLTLPAAAKEAEPVGASTPEPAVDREKLAALTRPVEKPAPAPVSEPTPEPAKPVDLSKANAKLSDLLKPK